MIHCAGRQCGCTVHCSSKHCATGRGGGAHIVIIEEGGGGSRAAIIAGRRRGEELKRAMIPRGRGRRAAMQLLQGGGAVREGGGAQGLQLLQGGGTQASFAYEHRLHCTVPLDQLDHPLQSIMHTPKLDWSPSAC